MLIPEKIEEKASTGEKIILHKFRTEASSQKYYVLHSLFIAKHLKTVSGELDFLVLAPGKGIFSLEVKHGDVKREGGIWYFKNRYGQTNTSTKGPFRQVSDTMHSLRTYILDKVSNDNKKYQRYSKILFGSGVIFSGLDDMPEELGPEAEPWMVYTRNLIRRSPVSFYIDILNRGWVNKFENNQWFNINECAPTQKECEEIVRLLRGDFDYKYSDINKIIDEEYRIEQFTKEQFDILNFADSNPRCLFEGAAGTGKTLMALELAKKAINKGKKVALFSFNTQLGKKLAEDLKELGEEKSGQYYASNIDAFLLQNTSTKVPVDEDEQKEFFSEQLPIEFLLDNEKTPEEDKFDLIIIDEAQDIITSNYLEVMDAILKGGIKNGTWSMFGDFTNQAIYINKPNEAIELLRSRACFSIAPKLTVNCRNTAQIAKQNTLLSGIDIPHGFSIMASGKGVSTFFPGNNTGVKIDEIINDLEKLISLDKITVLSPFKLENSGLTDSKYISEKKVSFSTIQAFKGLENTAIILTGFNEVNSDRAKRLLYVGISRARIYLNIVLSKKLEKDYQGLLNQNINKILEYGN
jgi:hypothetical protein